MKKGKQHSVISESNKEILRAIDQELIKERQGIEAIVQNYNNKINSLSNQKRTLLISIVNEKELSKDTNWRLTEEYDLVEVTKEEYEAELQNKNMQEVVNEPALEIEE